MKYLALIASLVVMGCQPSSRSPNIKAADPTTWQNAGISELDERCDQKILTYVTRFMLVRGFNHSCGDGKGWTDQQGINEFQAWLANTKMEKAYRNAYQKWVDAYSILPTTEQDCLKQVKKIEKECDMDIPHP